MRAVLEVVKNFVASTTMMSWGCGRKVIFRWGDLQLFWIVAHYIDSWPKYPHSPFIGQTERLQPENIFAQNHARAVLTRATDCLPAHCPLERMPLIYRKNMLIRYHYARLFRCTRCFGATVAVPSRWARDTRHSTQPQIDYHSTWPFWDFFPTHNTNTYIHVRCGQTRNILKIAQRSAIRDEHSISVWGGAITGRSKKV